MLKRCRHDKGRGDFLAISADGGLATDGAVLWGVPDGTLLCTVSEQWVGHPVLTPDSSLLIASGSYSGQLRAWSLPDGKNRREFSGHKKEITCLAVSPDGRYLASGSKDQDVLLWNLPLGTRIAALEDHPGDVTCLAMAPDSRTVVVGSKDGSVTLWDVTVAENMDEKGAESFAKLLNQIGDAPTSAAEQPKSTDTAPAPQPMPKAPSTGGYAHRSGAVQSPTANDGVTPLDTFALATLLEQPHGAALPMSVNDSGRDATAFVFRESDDRIVELARSGAFASVHIRSSLLGVGDVQLYVTLVRFGDQVFEIWWNWHNPIIRPLFDRLFSQDEVIVGFVSDRPAIANVHRYPSSIREPLRADRSQLTAAQPWTMEAFDRARATVEKEYPTPVALWQALGGGA
jgi:hypothetical protein